MSKKQMSLHKIGPILDSLVLDATAPKHPALDDADEIKEAYSNGVCGMLSLLGYDDSDLNTVVPRLLRDRMTEFDPTSLAYEREKFTTYLTETHPEVDSMTLASYRDLLEVLLPSVLGNREQLNVVEPVVEETVVVDTNNNDDDGEGEPFGNDDDEVEEDEETDVFYTATAEEAAEDALIEQQRIRAAERNIGQRHGTPRR